MSKTETEQKKHTKQILAYAIIVSFVAGLVVSPAITDTLTPIAPDDPTQAYMFLQGWTSHFSMPYDQGFEQVEIYQNRSGSWIEVDTLNYDSPDTVLEVPAGCSIKLTVYTWLNSTLVGAGTAAIGRNYQQHNVSVTDFTSSPVFTQQNFTYESDDTGIDPPLWLYEYSVILNFVTLQAEYYTVVIVYETYY